MSLLAVGILEVVRGWLMLMLAIRCWQSDVNSINQLNALLSWHLRSWLKGQVSCSVEGRIFNFLTLEQTKGWMEVLIASLAALLVAIGLR
jgi:hypothetical protein